MNLNNENQGIRLHSAIFSDSNQLISKLNEGPKVFCSQQCITLYHALSLLITLYHILLLMLKKKKKQFFISNFKISSQAADFLSHFITPCHSLAHLIAPYPLDWKENPLMLAGSFKISSQVADFLSHLIRPCHSLSLIITPFPLD